MTSIVEITRYTIFLDGEPTMFTIEWRGHDLWAVMNGALCLSHTDRWHYEPLPSSRSDHWLERHRFTLGEAMNRARAAAEAANV